MINGELSVQDEQFCQYVAAGAAYADAYVNAGYDNVDAGRTRRSLGQSGYNKTKVPEFSERIKQLKKERKAAVEAKAQEDAAAVIDKFDINKVNGLLVGIMQGKVKDVDDKDARLTERLKAIDLYARINGMMSNKTDISGDLTIRVRRTHGNTDD